AGCNATGPARHHVRACAQGNHDPRHSCSPQPGPYRVTRHRDTRLETLCVSKAAPARGWPDIFPERTRVAADSNPGGTAQPVPAKNRPPHRGVVRRTMRPKKTILCVDDNEQALSVRKFMLETRGYRVLGALNGHEALEIFQAGNIDLVLSDLVKPQMDGNELVRRMK